VRPNAKENGQLRPSNAIPDAWKAGSRPYPEFGFQTSSENASSRVERCTHVSALDPQDFYQSLVFKADESRVSQFVFAGDLGNKPWFHP
jgi:hypothetical protein